MANKSIKEIAIKRKRTQQQISTPNGSLTVYYEDITIIFKIVKETKQKCYLLALSKNHSKRLKQIVGQLLIDGKIKSTSIAAPIDTAVIFISDENLKPLQRHIHNTNLDLKFVLVRLNQTNIPKQNYC